MGKIAKVTIPAEIADEFVGIDVYGHRVIETHGMRVPLTDCCAAAVTYHDEFLCCKACWEEVDFEYDTITPEIALTRDQLVVTIASEGTEQP